MSCGANGSYRSRALGSPPAHRASARPWCGIPQGMPSPTPARRPSWTCTGRSRASAQERMRPQRILPPPEPGSGERRCALRLKRRGGFRRCRRGRRLQAAPQREAQQGKQQGHHCRNVPTPRARVPPSTRRRSRSRAARRRSGEADRDGMGPVLAHGDREIQRVADLRTSAAREGADVHEEPLVTALAADEAGAALAAPFHQAAAAALAVGRCARGGHGDSLPGPMSRARHAARRRVGPCASRRDASRAPSRGRSSRSRRSPLRGRTDSRACGPACSSNPGARRCRRAHGPGGTASPRWQRQTRTGIRAGPSGAAQSTAVPTASRSARSRRS